MAFTEHLVLPTPMLAVIISIVLTYALVLTLLFRQSLQKQSIPLIAAAGFQLVVGGLLALAGILQPLETRPPFLLLMVIPSILIGALGLPLLPGFRGAISALSPAALYLPHIFRVLFGASLLVLASRDALPWVFAEPVGLGDIVAGLTAPLIFLAVRSGRPWARPAGLVWNAFGMLDFLQAGLIGFLAGSGPQHRILAVPPTDLLTIFPVSLIPTFAVVSLYVLHAWSVRSLLAPAPRESSVSAQVPPGPWTNAPAAESITGSLGRTSQGA